MAIKLRVGVAHTSCANWLVRGIVHPFQAEGEGSEEDLVVGVGVVL